MEDIDTSNKKHLEIQSLTKLGHDLLVRGSTLEASETFLNAFQIAKQSGDLYVSRGCCFNLGACYVAAGQPKVGLKYLELAIPLEDNNDGVENEADLWYNIGIARHSIGEIKDAVVAYEKAQVGYSRLKTQKLEGECLSKLAVCYHLCGRLKDSQETYYKAHELYERLKDRSNQALCLVSLTSIFSELEDIDGCAKVLDILLDVCQDVEDKYLQAKIYHDIGLLYISENLYESAAECLEQSWKCMEKDLAVQDKHLEGTVLQNLGAVYNHMGSFQKAIGHHQRAVDIYGELHDRRGQTQVFANLAFAHTQLQEYDNAIMSFQHALQAAKDCGDKESHCLSTEGLAAVYFRKDDYEKSICYYKEALSLVSGSNLGNEHSDRIVEKLSDAIQIQVDGKSSFRSSRQPKSPVKQHTHEGKQRFLREKHHSLIAKGLEAESSYDDESESLENSEESSEKEGQDRVSSARKSDRHNDSFSSVASKTNSNNRPRTASSQSRIHRNELHTTNDNGMKFSMKSSLGKSQFYEQPVSNETNELQSRDAKELHLASVNNVVDEQAPKQKESSKTCVLM